MSTTLDVIILDDDQQVAELLENILKRFYVEGSIYPFSDMNEAKTFCFNRESSLAIFVLDFYLGESTAFDFLSSIRVHYPMAPHDTVIITGRADDKIVDICVAGEIHCLLEKPIESYALRFAIQSIVSKYHGFAKKLWEDTAFARDVKRISGI